MDMLGATALQEPTAHFKPIRTTWRHPVVVTPAPRRLTQREIEVMRCITAGDGNKQIARVLKLSPHTVKRHVANILAKLGVATRGQAAACWRQQA